jgi:hypothetical protein
MKIASIICTFILLCLLWLVLPRPDREGFIILLDESYRAEIIAANQNTMSDLHFPAARSYENISNQELRRAVEGEENFTPESVFQNNETVYLTDSKSGKLTRFTSHEGLQTIAVFGGKLKNLQKIAVDQNENICIAIQSDSNDQKYYFITLKR